MINTNEDLKTAVADGKLDNLEVLDLGSTQVTDLTPLQTLTKLWALSLSNTKVSDLTPLQALTGLQNLDLRNTKVSDLTPLQALTGLQRLHLRNTQVSDLSPLRGLTGLRSLDLAYTRVPVLLKEFVRPYTLRSSGGIYVSGCRIFVSPEAALNHWGSPMYPNKLRGQKYCNAIRNSL